MAKFRVFNLLKIFLYLLALLLLGCFFIFILFAKDLPRPERFTEGQVYQSTKIFDRTGKNLLYEIYGEEKRTIIPFSEMPDHLKKAVIATEDANFYNHFGIDFGGLIRSIKTDIKTRSLNYGGSTIPQQLIRSTFFSTEKTATRKIREIILSLELDRRYKKDDILGWYLNQVPFGENTYGAEAASQTYFKKKTSELSLAQSAVLAALIKGPSYYSPYGNHKKELLARKDYVLDRMAAEHYITQEEAETAKKEELKFEENIRSIKAPHFTLWVKDYLEEKYGEDFLREKGLNVYTSLDWEMQQSAEKIVKENAEKNKANKANNAALVAIDPKNGEILSMVGSADYFGESYPKGCTSGIDCLFDPKFNVAVGTKENPGRQPGSSFKPFVYVTAFEKGYDDKTVMVDLETNFGLWGGKYYVPQNYDGRFRGAVTLRQALAQSLNIPSVRALYLAGGNSPSPSFNYMVNFTGHESIFSEGLKNSIETAKKMGISTLSKPLSNYGPAIVLGGGEVKLLEMVSAYGVFAREGLRVPPISVLKIIDNQGNIIEENKKTPQRVLSINSCRIINDILSDNVARAAIFGANSALYFSDYQVAAKTGTTQDYRDAWVIGYTPSIVVGVWAGNNDNSSIDRQTGAMIAAPMWHQFLGNVLAKMPKENFTKPENYNLPANHNTSTNPTSSSL